MLKKILLFLTIYFVSQISSAEKLKVTIYYESECRFSKNYIQTQIKPNYEALKDRVKFVYVPFGKSSHIITPEGDANFTCQHGPIECYGNVWELCGLDMIGSDQDRQSAFVFCDMNPDRNRERCTLDAGLSVLEVEECTKTRGEKLKLDAEKVTAPIIEQSGKVPTIVYNDQYNLEEYSYAYADFKGYTETKLESME